MGRIVIAGYRPKPGKQEALERLILEHVATLRSLGLVTDREPITMKAGDGTIVEVFEWRSAEAIAQAHTHPAVRAMWDQYDEVCDYVPVAQVAEAAQLFSEFTPVEGVRRGPRPEMQPPQASPGQSPPSRSRPRPTPAPAPPPVHPPHNEFGDPLDTLYAGGTPRFDETGGGGGGAEESPPGKRRR